MKILNLKIKKKWFDMIVSGEKTQEYREIKPYYTSRFRAQYDAVLLQNGYAKSAPWVKMEVKCIHIAYGRWQWGAPKNKPVYIIELGEVLDRG